MKRLLFPVITALLGLLATAVAGEVLVRAWTPTPRIQIFRPEGDLKREEPRIVEVDDGVPTWSFPSAAPRYDLDCPTRHPDALRVVVLGSSIFAGVSVDPTKVFTQQLAQTLFPGEHVCVMNLAEPAYSFQNQAKVAERYLETLRPDLVVWEIWGNSPWPYKVLDGTAYRFRSLIVGEDGTPNPLRTWPPLHRWLIPRSRLYELAVLSLAVEMHPAWIRRHVATYADGPFTDTLRWVTDELQIPVLAVFCPTLDRPFAEQRDARLHPDPKRRDERYIELERVVDALRLPKLHLDARFAELGVQPEDIRLDPCCHYDEGGQAVLAEAVAPEIRSLLRPPP
jgi:hypothetical protein